MFFDRFIRYIKFEKRYSRHTVSAYESDLNQFFAFINNPEQILPVPSAIIKHPNEITHFHIRSWMVNLMDQDIIARSINRKIATLRKYFKFLVQEGEISVNPASRIHTPKIPKNLPIIVEDVKLTQMLDDNAVFGDDFKGVRDKLIVEMLFGTGMRLSELLGIKESDINFLKILLKY